MLSIESKMEVFAKTYSKDTGVDIRIGHNYCTDGKRIWVAPISDQADPTLRKKTEVIVYHETGHIKAGDVKFNPKDRIRQRIYNWVRDVAVEHDMETEYPGMKQKWAEFLVAHNKENQQSNPQDPIYNKVMRILYLTCRGKQLGVDLSTKVEPEVQELFDKKFAQYIDPICNDGSVATSLNITEEIYKSFTTEEKEQPKNGKGQKQKGAGKKSSKKDDDAGAGDSGDPDQAPEDVDADDPSDPEDQGSGGEVGKDKETGAGNPENEESEDVDATEGDDEGDSPCNASGDEDSECDPDGDEDEGDQASSGQTDDPATSGDQPSGNDPDDSSLSDEAKEALEQIKKEIENEAEGKTIAEETTDELNEYVKTNKVYRTVAGLKDVPKPIEKQWYWERQVAEFERNGREVVGYLGGKMKRLFVSERAPVWQRNLRSGKLDIKKTWKVALGSQDVMRRRTQGVYEDACVYEVIDHSQSMEENDKFKISQGILTAVSSDLDKLRIPFGAVGFTCGGFGEALADEGVRDRPITLNHIKGFNEPYRRIRHRFVWPHSGATCELPAIEFAAKQLAMRRESKKILFILTDGATYTGNHTLDSALREATKEYVERLLKAGVKVVGIGIQDTHMRYYCPDFIHVSNLSNFASDFYRKLTKLLL